MAGMANYLINKLVDWFHRGQVYVPPATVYIELCSTSPTAAAPGVPLAGAGYARKPIASTLAAWSGTQGDGSIGLSTGTTGTTSNNVIVDYGIAGAAWGTASHWEAYDALVAGNRLIFGEIVNGVGVATPRVINTGDPVNFPIAALRVQWG